MIHPSKAALFIPPGLKKFKLDLFERIGRHIANAGGRIVRDDERRLLDLPNEMIPVVGCTPALRPLIDNWRATGRTFAYWDRGYARRVFATWLPRGAGGGYYRWEINALQMKAIRDVPGDRWTELRTAVSPWSQGGKHIVIAAPTQTYSAFHRTDNWTEETVAELKRFTDRPIVIRTKDSKLPLDIQLQGAHALVSHQSNAAVEAVIMGCPVFVHPESAAALVGKTDLAEIETPIYPGRKAWLNSLAYSQFNERELVDGTLWRLIA